MMITADYATVDHSTGKFHVLGAFRTIQAKEFPFQHKRMCLALILEGEIADSRNPHDLTVTLTDEDGNPIFSMRGAFELPESLHGIPPHCNLLFEFNDLPFENPGEYCFYVTVNDAELQDSTVIQVVKHNAGRE